MTAGVVHDTAGFGWGCLVCIELGCSPLDVSDRPALVIMDGNSLCAVHVPFYDSATFDDPGSPRLRITAAAGRAQRAGVPRRVL